jgi:hypothetical protein
MLLTPEEFGQLKVDDTVEADGLFPPLSKEPMVLRVAERSETKIEFVVTYFGVTLGRWQAENDQGRLTWRF